MKPFPGTSRMVLKMGKEHPELKPVIWHQSLRGHWRWGTGQQPAEHLIRVVLQELVVQERGISPNELHLKMENTVKKKKEEEENGEYCAL